MNLNYGAFFSIELLHEYFHLQKCSELEIIPTQDCKLLARKMNIQWRIAENRLVAMIRENDANEPFINQPRKKNYRKYYSNTVFRFYLKMKSPVFLNYTNMDLSFVNSKKKLYFSNNAENIESGMLYLTKPIQEFSLNKTYLPGQFVKDGATGLLYENIKKHTLKKKAQLTDASNWIPKGLAHQSRMIEDYKEGRAYSAGDYVFKPASEEIFEAAKKHTSVREDDLNDTSLWLHRQKGVLQYPAGQDSVEFTNGSYAFGLSEPVSKATVSILGFNYNEEKPAYDLPVLTEATVTFDKPETHIDVNFSQLPAGRYLVKVNKDTKTVYYDPALNAGEIFGIVEIFNHHSGDNDYSLLRDDEKLKHPQFKIHFANRRVLWKYIRKDGKAQQITDTGETNYIFNLEGDDFVSAIPIPLYESVCKTLKLEFNTKDFRLFPLPNPQITRLAKYKQHDYDYLCLELYLNY